MEWKNKVAVITGAGGVLCGEIAKEYAAMGASVALLDINLPAAEKVAEEIKKAGGVAVAYKADCLDKSSLQAVHATQVFAGDMIERNGNIVNISSMNAYRPLTRIPAYSGAKASISNFTQWLAVYFAKSGIRVNAIAPGFFVTNQNRGLLFDKDGAPTARTRKILAGTPMGRFGESKEIMGALKWLTDNEQASFVTGIVIPIDGGFSAYSGV